MKKKVLIELKVVCDPPRMVVRWARTLEEQANNLEGWCREFESFVRDHRSQDPVGMAVERVYEEQCSHCGCKWETDEDGVPVCCNKAEKEFEAQVSGVDAQRAS